MNDWEYILIVIVSAVYGFYMGAEWRKRKDE